MILTVTPNPSLDLLFEADRLRWDDANRIPEPRRRPGGQGINTARAAIALGGNATALALLGGPGGDEIEAILRAEGTPVLPVPASSPTRLFIAIRESETGRSMLLNSPGPERSPTEADAFIDCARATIASLQPSWVACCGSVPPGFPPDLYATIGLAAREAGARFVPDCDGEPLRLAAPLADLLVPNHHEAERLAGRPAGDTAAAALAALALHGELGTDLIAITLGPAGAVLHDGRDTRVATPPPIDGPAVGAGDCFLAGLLIAIDNGRPVDVALRQATAAGAAAVAARGTSIIDIAALPEVVEATTVRSL